MTPRTSTCATEPPREEVARSAYACHCALAVSGGIATPNDGIKAILAGADVVQLVSALLRHGPAYVGAMRQGLERWMASPRLDRVEEMRGRASLHSTGDAAAFERASYIRTLHSWIRP